MQSFTVGWGREVAGHRVSSVRKEGVGAQLSLSPLCLLGTPASGMAPPKFRVDPLTSNLETSSLPLFREVCSKVVLDPVRSTISTRHCTPSGCFLSAV